MKKTRLLSLLIVLFAVPTLSAQNVDISTIDREGRTLESVKREYKEKQLALRDEEHRELMETANQFRIGIGRPLDLVPTNPSIYVPSINLEYSYRAVDFLEVGFVAGYGSGYNNYFEVNYGNIEMGSHTFSTRRDESIFNLGVFVRYSWYSRKWFSIYSTLGVSLEFKNTSYLPHPESTTKINERYTYLVPDISPIGFRIGGRLFAYFEPIVIGFRGSLFTAGVGYKF